LIRRPSTICGEGEAAGLRFVRRLCGFLAHTLNFEKPRVLTAEEASPESPFL
jgi:hypothetical protein